MKIQVLGTGCSKCKQLTANAEKAVAELGLAVAVEKVEDIREIMKFSDTSTGRGRQGEVGRQGPWASADRDDLARRLTGENPTGSLWVPTLTSEANPALVIVVQPNADRRWNASPRVHRHPGAG
jgi:hypothetical protein